MTDKKKPEPPLHIDMPLKEAIERFVGVDPAEVEANIAKSKKKKPPGSKRSPSGPRKRKSASNGGENVVQLKDRRKPPIGG